MTIHRVRKRVGIKKNKTLLCFLEQMIKTKFVNQILVKANNAQRETKTWNLSSYQML